MEQDLQGNRKERIQSPDEEFSSNLRRDILVIDIGEEGGEEAD